jgi:hypothetical protein
MSSGKKLLKILVEVLLTISRPCHGVLCPADYSRLGFRCSILRRHETINELIKMIKTMIMPKKTISFVWVSFEMISSWVNGRFNFDSSYCGGADNDRFSSWCPGWFCNSKWHPVVKIRRDINMKARLKKCIFLCIILF